jgi:Fe2+ or Zn2+ uptake regulation protein
MNKKEECRHDCLAYLAARSTLSFPAEAVARGVRRDGSDWGIAEVKEALEFLTGMDLVTATRDPLGSTYYYKATSAGVLAHERGRDMPS